MANIKSGSLCKFFKMKLIKNEALACVRVYLEFSFKNFKQTMWNKQLKSVPWK